MREKGRLIAFSQNFISDPDLVERLVRESCISSEDKVIEIGAGLGLITENYANSVKMSPQLK